MKLDDLTLEELAALHQALANGGRGAHREALRAQGVGTWVRKGEALKPLMLDDDDQLIEEDEPIIELRFGEAKQTG